LKNWKFLSISDNNDVSVISEIFVEYEDKSLRIEKKFKDEKPTTLYEAKGIFEFLASL
jgi:hypothetical protein